LAFKLGQILFPNLIGAQREGHLFKFPPKKGLGKKAQGKGPKKNWGDYKGQPFPKKTKKGKEFFHFHLGRGGPLGVEGILGPTFPKIW